MDLERIRAASERARRFTHMLGERQFDCVTPTQFEVDLLTQEHRTFARVQRQLVLAALRGWRGVTTADLHLPDLDDEPLPYSGELAVLLFDQRSDWEAALADEISARVKARREALEAARGN